MRDDHEQMDGKRTKMWTSVQFWKYKWEPATVRTEDSGQCASTTVNNKPGFGFGADRRDYAVDLNRQVNANNIVTVNLCSNDYAGT